MEKDTLYDKISALYNTEIKDDYDVLHYISVLIRMNVKSDAEKDALIRENNRLRALLAADYEW